MNIYMVVLKVSTGIRKIRKRAAATDAATVLSATGIFSVVSKESKAARVPVFAALISQLNEKHNKLLIVKLTCLQIGIMVLE
jgi:hypothetical protein